MAESAGIRIRPLQPGDARAFRALRLEALRLQPDAFGSSLEEESVLTEEEHARFIRSGPARVVLGAFEDSALIGMLGVYAHEQAKTRHKGRIWGVYVRQACRGRGIASAVLADAIAFARGVPGLEILQLTVGAHSTAARALYEAAGFRAFGLERHGMRLGPGDYRDEILMALDLTA